MSVLSFQSTSVIRTLMRLRTIAPILALARQVVACGHHPPDAALMRTFSDRRDTFEQIVRMAAEDKHLVRVASDFTWLVNDVSWPRKNVGLTAERWQKYRDLFREAGVPDGYLRVGEGGIELLASTSGLVTGGSAKGYVYSTAPLEPLFPTLDGPPTLHSNQPGYRHLDGPWYLFYEWDD